MSAMVLHSTSLIISQVVLMLQVNRSTSFSSQDGDNIQISLLTEPTPQGTYLWIYVGPSPCRL